jgi:hypothetical protein
MSLYLGTNLISGVATPVEGARNIGQIVQSTIPLTDAGLHLLDGALIQGSGSYSDFVTYIAGLVSNYPDIFTTEANWQSAVTTYGVCGKFVYDSTNNTVRLPKITGFTEGTTDVTALGDLIQAGLPNITGKFSVDTYINTSEGAFYQVGGLSGPAASVSFGTYNIGETYIDASRSNSIYGNSNTVQPQSIKTLYYIVIATSTKTDIQIDIDEIATDLNGKADVDLSNINPTQTVKNMIIGWGQPDYDSGVSISSGYTAPVDGVIIASFDWSMSGWFAYIDGYSFVASNNASGSGQQSSGFCIAPKNSVFTTNASGTFMFFPLKGVQNA